MNRVWALHALWSVVLWSSLAVLGMSLTHLPPFLILGIGLLIGALPSLRHCGAWFGSGWRVLVLGVGGIFGYHFFLFQALRLAPPVEANLINYLWPVLLVLMTPLFLKGYHLRRSHVMGGMLAFAGAVLIVTGGELRFQIAYWPGYTLGFLAALTWSTYSLMMNRLPPFPISAVGGFCLVSGVLSFAFHLVFEKPAAIQPGDWATLIAIGLGPMGLAFYSWNTALKDGDPSIVGGLSYLTPLLSSLALIVFGNEPASLPVLVAMAMIIAGAVIGSLDLFRAKA